jgi:hypothetical protein
MSFRATTLRRLLLVASLFTAIPGVSSAQQGGPVFAFARQDAVVTTLVKAVDLNNVPGANTNNDNPSNGAPDDSQWLKVEFHYSVSPAIGNYLNEIQFKVWIEGRDLFDPQGQPGQGIAVALTGSVTYANVPKGKDLYGVVYVHPSTLGRYGAGHGASDFERNFDVHVEADIAGSPAGAVDKNKEQDPNWYQQLRAIPGLVYRQNQCPFLNDSPDRYPAIKLPDSSSS